MEDGHAEREAAAKQRRIAETPEGHLSLRMCPRYGAMMGATSVSRDEIAKTTRREYDPTFTGIDSDDINCMLYATQLLMWIELTAAQQSLTMHECKDIATTHGSQHKRAEAAGQLIKTVNQWMAADGAASPDSKRPPPMPTLLGGTTATKVAGQPRQKRRRPHARRRCSAGRRNNDRDGRADGASTTRTRNSGLAPPTARARAANGGARTRIATATTRPTRAPTQAIARTTATTRRGRQTGAAATALGKATTGTGEATADVYTRPSTTAAASAPSTTASTGAASPGAGRATRRAATPATAHSAISTERVHHTTPDAPTTPQPSSAAPTRATSPAVGSVSGGSSTYKPRRISLRRHATGDGAAADEGRRAFDGDGSTRVGSGTVDDGRSDPRVDDADGPAPIDEHGGRRVHRRRGSDEGQADGGHMPPAGRSQGFSAFLEHRIQLHSRARGAE